MKKILMAAVAALLISGPIQAGRGPTQVMDHLVKLTDGFGIGSGTVIRMTNIPQPQDQNICRVGVLTASHVLYDLHWPGKGEDPSFSALNKDMKLRGAEMVYASRSKNNRDLAYAEFDLHYACSETGLTPAKLSFKLPKLGDTLYDTGYPYNIKTYAPVRVTLVTDDKFNPMAGTYGETVKGVTGVYIVTSSGVGPGNSGGGLYDKRGRLIAVLSIGETKPPGRGFYVPVSAWTQ